MRGGEEAAEAQHALERLRAVAGRRVAAPPQLALAQAEVVRERLHPRARVLQAPRGLGDRGVGGRRRERDLRDPARRLARLEVGGQPLGELRPQRRRGRRAGRAAPTAAARARRRPRRGGSARRRTRCRPARSPARGRCPARRRTRRGPPARSGPSRRPAARRWRRRRCGSTGMRAAGRRTRGTSAQLSHPGAGVRSVQDGAGDLGHARSRPRPAVPRGPRPHPRPPPLRAALPRRRRRARARRGRRLPQRRRRLRPRPRARRPHAAAASPPPPSRRCASSTRPTRGTTSSPRGACDQLAATAPAEGGAVFVAANVEGWPAAPVVAAAGRRVAGLHRPDPRHAARARCRAPVGRPGHRADVAPHRRARRPRRLRAHRRPALPRPRARPRARGGRRSSASSRRSAASSRSTPRRPARPTPRWPSRPSPDSIARPLFDDATIAAHLDHLAAGQQDDGGWTFNFPAWSPAARGGLARLLHGRRARHCCAATSAL